MTAELGWSADPSGEQLLDRYLAGEATEAECVSVEQWLTRHPADAATLDTMVHRLAGASPGDVEASLVRCQRSLKRAGSADRGTSKHYPSRWESFKARPLRWVVHTVFAELTSRAVVALFGRKVTTLTAGEIERLRVVVDQAETEDE